MEVHKLNQLIHDDKWIFHYFWVNGDFLLPFKGEFLHWLRWYMKRKGFLLEEEEHSWMCENQFYLEQQLCWTRRRMPSCIPQSQLYSVLSNFCSLTLMRPYSFYIDRRHSWLLKRSVTKYWWKCVKSPVGFLVTQNPTQLYRNFITKE